MKKNKDVAAVVEIVEPAVEIVFDFSKIGLFEFLDLMELSARSQDGGVVSAGETMGFIHVLRSAYVSSSRPLTVRDFEGTIKAFWAQAELFKNPNA
jgi:hypothetical protein